jgi:2,3-dihydroxybiphenyl 1,2-dioxygenase
MHIESLGYAGVSAIDVAAWKTFADAVLGMPVRETASGLALRMDDRVHRILVHSGVSNGIAYLGWDTGDGDRLATAASELAASGKHVQRATASELQARGVAQMCWVNDPLGNRVELFCGLSPAAEAFAPPRPTAGFRTGPLGFGHAVLTVPRVDDVLPFYRDVLGMRMSDYAKVPFHAVFLHVNTRHHSLALLETGQVGLHHLMIEAVSIDDLGRAYDAAIESDVVRVTLGRHTNDHMLSFYAEAPSGFMVEFGWGGRSIDDATWEVEEMVHGPSIWGHERSWLSDEKRVEARELRLQAAAAGLRAPVHVAPGEFDESGR